MKQRLAQAVSFQRRLPLLQLLALGLLFLYGAETIDGFSQGQSVRSMLVLASLLGLAAAGQTLVLLLGALDLSVPGLIVLGATVVSELCGSKGWSLGPALAVVITICGTAGALVGWLCHRFRILPIVVTLGVSALALGGVQVWTHSQVAGAAPHVLSTLVAANGTTFGLPLSPVVAIWAVVAVGLGTILHRTRSGRRIYATGANPRAAALSLIKTRKV
jgi:ribose transport system permease protein